jgi:hypothetical protein
MSLQQTFSSATPTALTGYAASENKGVVFITNTDGTNIIDIYLNDEVTPSATQAAGVTMAYERPAGITAIKIAQPGAASVVVCWGFMRKGFGSTGR